MKIEFNIPDKYIEELQEIWWDIPAFKQDIIDYVIESVRQSRFQKLEKDIIVESDLIS